MSKKPKDVWTRTMYQNGIKYTYYYLYEKTVELTYIKSTGEYVKQQGNKLRVYKKIGSEKHIYDYDAYNKQDHKRGPKFKSTITLSERK